MPEQEKNSMAQRVVTPLLGGAQPPSDGPFPMWVEVLRIAVWPAVVLVAIVFAWPLRTLFSTATELSAKAAGVEVSAKKAAATSLVVAASEAAARPDGGVGEVVDVARVSDRVDAVVTAGVIRTVKGSRVLWVNPHPENSELERKALETIGVSVVVVTTNAEAERVLAASKFDAVVSSMRQPDDPHAAFTLLNELPQLNAATPFVIYSASYSSDANRPKPPRPVFAVPATPADFFEAVLRAISIQISNAPAR